MEEHTPKKKFSISNLTKWDKISIVALVVFIILMAIPQYMPKGECEIARAGYECESAKNVMIENCEYWAKYNCDTSADVSLPQIEWYTENLCEIHNKNHNAGLDCANLKAACNQVSGKSLC